MAVKTITITKEAYDALKARKEKNESFSQTILRIAGKRKLSDFAGMLTKEEGDDLERNVRRFRKKWDADHEDRMRREALK